MICKIEGITKKYLSPSGMADLIIIDGVSLSIDKGESIAVTGPSGSGKSTLLHIAAGLEQPDSGAVMIDGNNVSEMSVSELAVLRNRKVGIVFQNHYLLPQCTLLENVLIPTLPYQDKQNRKKSAERAVYFLERMGLSDRLNHFPSQLSGGECQRVALARALINKPALLCADEPTGSLDKTSAMEMGKLLLEINNEEQTALLLVTHSDSLAAQMDKRLSLNGGRLSVKS
ncbi:MAG: ABC transporter ATP-binding protein [Chitinispirillales bacterium]|jgi:ABC-type lipoprotein export system ATPase subunit|nr:ABC transporter ATP-binding protein [Chitinispirillales bacterium]